MYEVIPVAAGIILGYFASHVSDSRMRNAVIAVLSVVIGVLASTIAGEAWFFIPFDVFQAAFASVVAVLVVNRYVKADSR